MGRNLIWLFRSWLEGYGKSVVYAERVEVVFRTCIVSVFFVVVIDWRLLE